MRKWLLSAMLLPAIGLQAATLEAVHAAYDRGDFVELQTLVREAPDHPAEIRDILRFQADLALHNYDPAELRMVLERHYELTPWDEFDGLWHQLWETRLAGFSGVSPDYDARIAALEEAFSRDDLPDELRAEWLYLQGKWHVESLRKEAGDACFAAVTVIPGDSRSQVALRCFAEQVLAQSDAANKDDRDAARVRVERARAIFGTDHPHALTVEFDHAWLAADAPETPARLDEMTALLSRRAPDSYLLRLLIPVWRSLSDLHTPQEKAEFLAAAIDYYRGRLPESGSTPLLLHTLHLRTLLAAAGDEQAMAAATATAEHLSAQVDGLQGRSMTRLQAVKALALYNLFTDPDRSLALLASAVDLAPSDDIQTRAEALATQVLIHQARKDPERMLQAIEVAAIPDDAPEARELRRVWLKARAEYRIAQADYAGAAADLRLLAGQADADDTSPLNGEIFALLGHVENRLGNTGDARAALARAAAVAEANLPASAADLKFYRMQLKALD